MSKKRCKKNGNYVQDNFLKFDRYSYPVSLNVNGKTSIRSYPGSITTLILLSILFCYAIIKF